MRDTPEPAGPGGFPARVAIFGVGLIGASLGLALRKAGFAGELVGVGRREESLRRALKAGAIDRFTTCPEEGFRGAGVVVLCAPVGAVTELLEGGVPGLGGDALVTDACSTKRAVVEAAGRGLEFPERFVGAHPIAGSEKSGPGAARADLFAGRTTILTPTACNSPGVIEEAERFWGSLGSRVLRLEPGEHDRVLALTSHLPHLVASAVSLMAGREPAPATRRCLGSGFRDFSRIAGGDPALWREIMAGNADNLAALLESLAAELGQWRQLLLSGDYAAVEKLLGEAAVFRRSLAAPTGQGEEKEGG